MRIAYISNKNYYAFHNNKPKVGHGMQFYSGFYKQKGYGFFSKLFRMALPFLQTGLLELGKHAASMSHNVIQDVEKGESFKTALKRRSAETGADMKDRIVKQFKPNQSGGGKKRKTKKKESK